MCYRFDQCRPPPERWAPPPLLVAAVILAVFAPLTEILCRFEVPEAFPALPAPPTVPLTGRLIADFGNSWQVTPLQLKHACSLHPITPEPPGFFSIQQPEVRLHAPMTSP